MGARLHTHTHSLLPPLKACSKWLCWCSEVRIHAILRVQFMLCVMGLLRNEQKIDGEVKGTIPDNHGAC